MPTFAWGVAIMIDVACPYCGAVYHADPIHLGKHIRCSKCGSLLPILGSKSTIAQPTDASGIRESQSRIEPNVPSASRRVSALRVGFASVVAVMVVGLAILWRHSNTREDTSTGVRSGAGESRTSPQPEGARQAPTVNPDGLPVFSVKEGLAPERGTVPQIAALFGGAEKMRTAVSQMQALLYAS